MSLFDRDNPEHQAILDRHRARWRPEREAALQHQLALMGLKGAAAKRLAEESDQQEKPNA